MYVLECIVASFYFYIYLHVLRFLLNKFFMSLFVYKCLHFRAGAIHFIGKRFGPRVVRTSNYYYKSISHNGLVVDLESNKRPHKNNLIVARVKPAH